MASKERKQPRGSTATYRGHGNKWSADDRAFFECAPQFKALAKMAENDVSELSHSQRKFLDDFAGRLADGEQKDGDTSLATSVVAKKGKERHGA